jgi:hypothetical protein
MRRLSAGGLMGVGWAPGSSDAAEDSLEATAPGGGWTN